MRAKDIRALVPVPSHVVKKVYSSVTLSKTTALYFLFALLYMFVQGGFQVASHMTNYNANGVLEAIRSKASVKGKVIPLFTPNRDGSGDTLRVCDSIPESNADQTCQPIFDAPAGNPRPKQHRDQNASTTTIVLQDNFSAPSDISLASQTPANGDLLILTEASPANIASSASGSLATGATKVAITPVGAGTVPPKSTQVSSANAVSPAPSAPAPSPSSSRAPAPGREAPSQAVTPSAPAPSTPAQAPSQASTPAPAQSPDPDVFVLSVPKAKTLSIDLDLRLPDLKIKNNKSKTASISTSTTVTPTSLAADSPTAPAPVPSTSEPVPDVSIGIADVDAIVNPVDDSVDDSVDDPVGDSVVRILGIGRPGAVSAPAPAPVTEAPATSTSVSTSVSETVSETVSESVSESAVETPAGSIGLLNVDGAVRVNVDILGGGNSQVTPSPQPTEAVPTPAPEVSQSSAPAEPTSTDTVETTEAAKETTEAAQGPTEAVNDVTQGVNTVIGGLLNRRAFRIDPIVNETDGKVIAVNITDLANSGSDEVVTIDRSCAKTLIFPHQEVRLAMKQDFVMLGYYIWLFALAFIAIINQSIPHLVAACISSLLAVAWSVYQVLHTHEFQQQFDRFITYGACNDVQLLPNYWKQRSAVEIPSLILNCVFALVLGGLAFKLIGSYRRSTSRLVGGQKDVGHLYKIVLVLTIVVQVTMFLIIASLALWINQLFEGMVASFSKTANIFRGIATISLVLALPWFILCWIAVRRENKPLMLAFFIVTALFIASLGSLFGSDAFRFIFSSWAFLRALTIASLVGLLISLGLSVWCRMGFGRGLAPQLAANSIAEDEKMPWEFSYNTEKAWQAFEPLPGDNNGLRRESGKGPFTGTTHWNTDAPRVYG